MKKMKGSKKSDEAEDQSVEAEEQDLEDSPKEKPKNIKSEKKSNPIIKIIIVIVLGYLAYDEFLVEKPESTPEAQVANDKSEIKPKRKKKLKREEEATSPDPVVTASQTTSDSNTTSSSSDPVSDDSMTNAISEVEIEAVKKKEEELKNSPVEEINIASTIGEKEKNNEQSTLDTSISQMNGEEIPSPKLENKIDENSEYTEPPKYEILGRGLVYNCKGKHWACVDKTNYQICFKNMKHNEVNGKPSECVTQNVYANEGDCSTIQRYNVSTNVATSFCKN